MIRFGFLLAVCVLAASALTAAAQQPVTPDEIDIEYSTTSCTVEIVWTDGNEAFIDLLESSIQTGAILDELSDVPVVDTAVPNQGQVLKTFIVDPGIHLIRAEIFDGEESIDTDRRTVECVAPTPTPTPSPTPTRTPTPEPTNTPVVVTATLGPATATSIPPVDFARAACLALGRNWNELTRECPVPPPAATPVPQVTQGSIQPPRTGSAGLLNVLWTRMFENDTGCDAGWCGGFSDYGSQWHYNPRHGLWYGWYY